MKDTRQDGAGFGNALYERKYKMKALVIAPHQDDEINIAASLISLLAAGGAEVFVLYATNGDWGRRADARVAEAAAALRVLGVPGDHMILLGYGDSFNIDPREASPFYTDDGAAVSKAGRGETYAPEGYVDFAFAYRGAHSPYNRESFTRDLMDAIEWVRAPLIACVDLDEHPDHRMLSLCFDRALNRLLKRDPGYRPQVLKRLAYACAYSAKPDCFRLNIPSTVRPRVGETARYARDMIDTSIYTWEDRLRLPAASGAVKRPLGENLIYRALACHASQHVTLQADSIINADEVFWERRTDNLALTSRVKASSGEVSYLNDGMILNARDIHSPVLKYADYCWRPDPGDEARKIRFAWDAPQRISVAALYGEVNGPGRIERVRIDMGGTSIHAGPLPTTGVPLVVRLEQPVEAAECVVTVEAASGGGCGIAEIEFFGDRPPVNAIGPFIKLTSGGEFIYDYIAKPGMSSVPLEIYGYGLEGRERDAQIEIVPDATTLAGVRIEDGALRLPGGRGHVTVRATATAADGSEVWDQIVVRKPGPARYAYLALSVGLEKLRHDAKKLAHALSGARGVLKRNGLSGTLKKALKKLHR